ncbi:putative Acyl-CoA-binding domain-containing protein 5 [Hypsibius exemplaris]|uniref:Acyl-CoA-binding domain-containing protein 5 n=1 Tax=Hypsibius exemplaris TaxID=2072580 RepID=A0A1W0WT38_HYPEX|nr:putative Acyl-CoA-binding domain-containing protein 5 [Hypsibius exemplaris]
MKEDNPPSSIRETFEAAVQVIRTIPSSSFQPSREMTLRFYGLYKQALEGPCKTLKPSFYEVENSAKWHAWKAEENLSQEAAMEEYVMELKKIVEMMSLTPEVSDFLDKVGNFYELIGDDGKSLPVKPKAEPLRPMISNGSANENSLPTNGSTNSAKPPNTLSLMKRPLPAVIDATVNAMLRPANDNLSDPDDDDVGSEAFQDARSNSESDGLQYQNNHSGRAGSSRDSVVGRDEKVRQQHQHQQEGVFQTLYPELEKLKIRMAKLEQRGDNHAERLLAVELLAGRLSKQQHTPAPLGNGVGGSTVSQTSVSRTYPRFWPENRIARLLHRYWVLLENRLRQHPSLTILAAILWPLFLRFLIVAFRRIVPGRR